jgi:phospholipase D1/2
MFVQLQARCPGIQIDDYLSFFSLRNWGVINDQVVSEQVYIHDKLMIVDDRIVVVGSANCNDRSMLGSRDSEMAVRIEDTLHQDITMNGKRHTVGILPHNLRMQLMRQHLSDLAADVSDILDNNVFHLLWVSRAKHNTALYDELDGDISVYRCKTVAEFRAAFARHRNKRMSEDPELGVTLSEIKGFLVQWPYELFLDEDLSPSIATRAIIPNELWV